MPIIVNLGSPDLAWILMADCPDETERGGSSGRKWEAKISINMRTSSWRGGKVERTFFSGVVKSSDTAIYFHREFHKTVFKRGVTTERLDLDKLFPNRQSSRMSRLIGLGQYVFIISDASPFLFMLLENMRL